MDDQVNALPAAAAAAEKSPMERAIEGGYKEPEAPTRDERVKTVVADLEHAIRHNAPVTMQMLAEIKDLLGVEGERVVDEPGVDQNVKAAADT